MNLTEKDHENMQKKLTGQLTSEQKLLESGFI